MGEFLFVRKQVRNMADKWIEGLKTFMETFAKQVSLNVLLFTVSSVSALIYIRSKSEIALYVGFGCLIFLITSLMVKYIPKLYARTKEKKFYKRFYKPRFQKKMLSKLDSDELDIIRELYETYPEQQSYDAYSTPIAVLIEYAMIRGEGRLIQEGYILTQRYTLQPWVKQALDKNKEFLEKES